MDTKQLEIFLSVSKSLNFTKAAQEHYMTQPAISHQISELENELGAKLFHRSSHHVALTTAGEEFRLHARELLAQSRLAVSRVYDVSHGKTGHIRVLTVQDCLKTAVNCLTMFSKQYPGIKIEADIVTGAEQMEAINNGTADIFFGFASLMDSYPQIKHRTLRLKHYILVLPGDYDGKVDINDFTTLKDLPFICERDSEAPFLVGKVMEICRNRNLTPVNIYWCNSAISQILAVRCGMGFALIPSLNVNLLDNGIKIISLQGADALADDTIGWRKDTGNQAVEFFLNIVNDIFPHSNEPMGE